MKYELSLRNPKWAPSFDDLRHLNLWFRIRWRALLWALERRRFRNNELGVIGISAIIGIVVGFAVVVVHQGMQRMHELAFGLDPHQLLSEGVDLDWRRVLIVPVAGGLIVGLVTVAIRYWRPREAVDAIEANALYGGRMSFTDSINIAILTLLSGGFGASVGLEAAYTQVGAGVASKVGRVLRMRRGDLRTLVGCGAAAAIAAAFNAPLAGAFYAFELVIGSYSPAVLVPVGIAAVTGAFTARWTLGSDPLFLVSGAINTSGWDYAFFSGIGMGAAILGIAIMVTVTWVERVCRYFKIPVWLRPMLGGVILAGTALFFPQVLGSGHGAMQVVIDMAFSPFVLLLLVPAKAIASAISVGSGFRGGLFSSSLFLGALFGSAIGGFIAHVAPQLHIDTLAYTLVGMGAVAAAVVGAPVTMILLVLEMTANFYVAMGVMVAVFFASTVVRLTFGYSFATWRFHIRGKPIRGGSDVGWMHDLIVGRLMRRDIQTALDDLPLVEFRQRFPLGSSPQVFLVDADGRYAGMVNTSDAHVPDLNDKIVGMSARNLAHGIDQYLLPNQTVRAALDRFTTAEMETLPVVDNATDRKVIGFITEAFAQRQYLRELERARAEELGDNSLFGPV